MRVSVSLLLSLVHASHHTGEDPWENEPGITFREEDLPYTSIMKNGGRKKNSRKKVRFNEQTQLQTIFEHDPETKGLEDSEYHPISEPLVTFGRLEENKQFFVRIGEPAECEMSFEYVERKRPSKRHIGEIKDMIQSVFPNACPSYSTIREAGENAVRNPTWSNVDRTAKELTLTCIYEGELTIKYKLFTSNMWRWLQLQTTPRAYCRVLKDWSKSLELLFSVVDPKWNARFWKASRRKPISFEYSEDSGSIAQYDEDKYVVSSIKRDEKHGMRLKFEEATLTTGMRVKEFFDPEAGNAQSDKSRIVGGPVKESYTTFARDMKHVTCIQDGQTIEYVARFRSQDGMESEFPTCVQLLS